MSHLLRKYLVEKKNEKEWKRWFETLWDGTKIYIVDGPYIRDNMYVDFTMGGHGYVYDFIPKDEIWLEEMLIKEDDSFDLMHEIYEYTLMKYVKGFEKYEKAHDASANVEKVVRDSFTMKARKIEGKRINDEKD